MLKFKNMKSLKKYLQKQIDKTLKSDVAPVIKKTLHNKIQENVYDSYEPKQYKRRHQNGGLGDERNIITNLEEPGILAVMNVAQASPSKGSVKHEDNNITKFSRWIEQGVPNIFNDEYYVWERPALFMAETKQELEDSGTHIDALKKGLKKNGINME